MRLRSVITKAAPAAVLGRFTDVEADLAALPWLPELDEPSGTAPDLVPVPVSPDQPALILFTSGSTGAPKGVLLPHRVLLGNARATAGVIGLDASHRLFLGIPFEFVSAISHFLVTLLVGGTFVGAERRFLPAGFWRAVEDSGADAVGGAPIHARWLAEAAAEAPLPLRWMMSSGDHLPADVIDSLRASLPDLHLIVAYGLTEVGGRFCILTPADYAEHRGAVGRPIPGLDVFVESDAGIRAEAGEVGAVFACGNWVFSGYIGDPAATAAVLDERGFRTGDLGHLDAQGCLTLSGRADDVFKVAGEKVSTQLIAAALMATERFADVAVLPVDIPALGQAPQAVYVLKPGAAFDKSTVIAMLRHQLPATHIPVGWTETTAIPHTGSGKVIRPKLRALIDDPDRSGS